MPFVFPYICLHSKPLGTTLLLAEMQPSWGKPTSASSEGNTKVNFTGRAVNWIKGFKRNLTLILTLPILCTIPVSLSALILHRFCAADLNKEQMKGKELWSISTAQWLSPPEGIKPACLVSYNLICVLCSAYSESTYQRGSIYFMISKYEYMINLNFKLYPLNRASFHGFLGCVKLYIIPNSCQCVNTQLKYFPDSYKESS